MMSSTFKWPSQLKPAKSLRQPASKIQSRYILVRKKPDPLTGIQKTASSSDGLIDIAAAVHLGLIPSAGLSGLLLHVNRRRVEQLLKHNTVVLVKPKKATIAGNHVTKTTLKLADEAIPAVLGPAYWDAHKHLGCKAALKSKVFIKWVKRNLEDTSSPLSDSLRGTKFEDLIGLKHSHRWWLNLLDIRRNMQSNLTP